MGIQISSHGDIPGEGFEIIFVRADTVGVFQQLRQAVLKELEQRTGRNLIRFW